MRQREQEEEGVGMDRRSVLKLGFGAVGLVAFGATPVFARGVPPHRTLSLDNVHTGESLRATYWERGRYLPDGLAEIDRILRDYRTDETINMDTRLLDLLLVLHTTIGSGRPFEVLSGYRSPATNAALLQEGFHVAENSFHIVGKAIDIRLPDRSPAVMRRAALQLHRGGVGYYPRSGFVHVDVGPVRHW
jgi:uncharacterized protein YcbK (DUF882 family)